MGTCWYACARIKSCRCKHNIGGQVMLQAFSALVLLRTGSPCLWQPAVCQAAWLLFNLSDFVTCGPASADVTPGTKVAPTFLSSLAPNSRETNHTIQHRRLEVEPKKEPPNPARKREAAFGTQREHAWKCVELEISSTSPLMPGGRADAIISPGDASRQERTTDARNCSSDAARCRDAGGGKWAIA